MDEEVIELAEFHVDPGQVDRFLVVVGSVLHLIKDSVGCRDAQIYKVRERDGSVVLLVHWDSIASHLDGFRVSDSYGEWRAAISPYFVDDPSVVHLSRWSI